MLKQSKPKATFYFLFTIVFLLDNILVSNILK